MVAPKMKAELGFDNKEIGLIFAAFTAVYAVSRIVSGMISDRVDPRFFLAFGLVGSACCNMLFGMSSILGNLMLFWGINAFFQSLGAPSCARILKHSIDKKNYGTYWALWSSSNPIGSGLIFLFLSLMIPTFGWRTSITSAAFISIAVALLIYFSLRRYNFTFEYAGRRGHTSDEEFAKAHMSYFREILTNKMFLRVCIASFCLYSIRVGLFNWFPQIMYEVKGAKIQLSGFMAAIFEVGSLAGGLLAGWVSDKYFHGNRGAVGFFYMFSTALVLLLLWFVPIENGWIYTLIVMLFGFLAFGPQVLAGVSALDHASRKTVGLATGFISLFGYMGASFTSYFLGYLSEEFGWGWGFALTIMLALMGAFFFKISYKK